MNLKQIFILALCLVPAWTYTSRCYNESELNEVGLKKLSRIPQTQEPSGVLPSLPTSCPLDLYERLPEDIRDRSLSPWAYIKVTNQDYFPPTYAEARCLCEGCIMMTKNGSVMENQDYNSKPVLQSRGFLKRERSDCREGMYRLTVEYRQVAVGCTCVTASTVSS